MTIYRITNGHDLVVETAWQPMAEAAWHRATRDQHTRGSITLAVDGRVVATHRVTGGAGAAWPLRGACGLRDVVKALMQLLRKDDWDTKQIADAMTAQGLPTSRARVEAMRGSSGRSIEMSAAEVVTMIYALLPDYDDETTTDG